jgi:hypothetical protein
MFMNLSPFLAEFNRPSDKLRLIVEYIGPALTHFNRQRHLPAELPPQPAQAHVPVGAAIVMAPPHRSRSSHYSPA